MKVALPAGVCANAAMAVRLAGHVPVYLDVDPGTLGLSVETLEACPEPLGAVLAVHAYGSVCDIQGLRAWCDRRGVLLVEDFAAAQGAQVGGRPVGSFGHVSVASFGAGKIVSLGMGGAALTADRSLFEAMEAAAARLPCWSSERQEAIESLMGGLRALYNRQLGGDLNGSWREFEARAAQAGPGFLCRFEPSWEAPLLEKLRDLPATVERRRRGAARLAEALARAGCPVAPIVPPAGSVHWRLNLLFSSGRDRVLRGLLDRGLKASSWYPAVDLFFRDRDARPWPLPVADRIGDQILNLWVDGVDEAYPDAVAAAVSDLSTDSRQVFH